MQIELVKGNGTKITTMDTEKEGLKYIASISTHDFIEIITR